MGFIERWKQPERYGWVVVSVASLVMAMGFGSLLALTVFLGPLEAEFGWQRGDTSFAYSSAALLTGFGGIFMGRLVDRITTRPIVLFGVVMLGSTHIMLGFITQLWQLYLLYGLCLGALSNASFLTPLMANVAFWFEKNKGVAMGIVLAGQSLGAALMPFVARMLIAEYGWRQAYLIMGVFIWVFMLPLALLVREPPGLAKTRADALAHEESGGKHHAMSPRALTAVLCTAIVFCCINMVIPMLHVYPLGLESGFPAAGAAGVLTVLMAFSIIGRVGIGKVAEVIGGIPTLLLASGIQTLTIIGFILVDSLTGFYVIAILFGLGYGGVIPSYAIIVRELIPAHRFGGAMGMVFFFGNFGMSIGGYLGGLLHDLSGAYPYSFGLGSLGGMVNLMLVGALWFYLRTKPTLAAQPATA